MGILVFRVSVNFFVRPVTTHCIQSFKFIGNLEMGCSAYTLCNDVYRSRTLGCKSQKNETHTGISKIWNLILHVIEKSKKYG